MDCGSLTNGPQNAFGALKFGPEDFDPEGDAECRPNFKDGEKPH